jgi:hypothetical protein
MNDHVFLYWDNYEVPKGDTAGESSSTADSPEDDSKESRIGEDKL